MVGTRSAVLWAWLATAACSGADVDLGGGRLTDGTLEGDGGSDWDGSFDERRSSRGGSGDGDGDGSGSDERRDDRASSDGNGGGDDGSRDDPDADDDAGRCDPTGPYCTDGDRVFANECDAERAGVRDATYCPWVEP